MTLKKIKRMKTLQNKQYLNRKTLSTSINCAKKILIIFAEKNGIYENFGQTQVSLIKEKFINISDYSKKMNLNRDQIQAFSDWCATFSI